MGSSKEIIDLVSLLKVFDVNFVNDEDLGQLSGLDVNSDVDVHKAINALLIPEFFSYLPSAQSRMLDILRNCLSDEAEDFSALFDRIELAFDESLVDRRRFMSTVFDVLASTKN